MRNIIYIIIIFFLFSCQSTRCLDGVYMGKISLRQKAGADEYFVLKDTSAFRIFAHYELFIPFVGNFNFKNYDTLCYNVKCFGDTISIYGNYHGCLEEYYYKRKKSSLLFMHLYIDNKLFPLTSDSFLYKKVSERVLKKQIKYIMNNKGYKLDDIFNNDSLN